MKNLMPLVLILLSCTFASGLQNPGDWTRFDSSAGIFSVLMPCQPTESKNTTESKYGPYTVTLYTCKTTSEVYSAGFVDYDPSFNFDVQKELEANRDNFIKEFKATLGNTSQISHKSYPGIEFDGSKDYLTVKSRVYIVGRRPYMLLMIYRTENGSQNISKFLSSFDVRPKS